MPLTFRPPDLAKVLTDMNGLPPSSRAATKQHKKAKDEGTDKMHDDHEKMLRELSSLAFGRYEKERKGVPAFIFRPMRVPRPGDWLTEHQEGQSMVSFERFQFKAVPHGGFNTIVVALLGEHGFSELLKAQLKDYVSAFYQLKVEFIGPIPIDQAALAAIRSRQNSGGDRQLFAPDAMRYALDIVRRDRQLTRRTVATMALTMEDLVNREDWEFVYGLASLVDGCGVFSMYRFSPEFNGEHVSSQQERDRLILTRSCKVLTHELGHIFGLKHCIYFRCLMNGANHIAELDQQRLLECPVCTLKLLRSFTHWMLVDRWSKIAECLSKLDLHDSAAMILRDLVGQTSFDSSARDVAATSE